VSDVQKPSKKRKSKGIAVPKGIYAGHRDIAEKISALYYQTLSGTSYGAAQPLLDMDNLTNLLASLDPRDLETFIRSEFGQGFLMGVFHQVYAYEMVAEQIEAEEDPK
jgi:hypothetical protein